MKDLIGTIPQWITALVAVLSKIPAHTQRKLVAALIWLLPFAGLIALLYGFGLPAWAATLAVGSSGLLCLGLVKYYPTLHKHTFHLLFQDEQ